MNLIDETKFNYVNMPLRDKRIIEPYRNKSIFIDTLPDMVFRHMEDHDAFFLTMTFKNTRIQPEYKVFKEYFNFFRRQLDHKLLSHSKQYNRSPKLILVPEQAMQIHFHGFVLIHKETRAKFDEKLVTKIDQEFIEKLNETRTSLTLHHSLINSYPDSVKFQNLQNAFHAESGRLLAMTPILTVADYKMYELSAQDVHPTASYSTKNFRSSSFADDQIILETKPSPKSHK